MSGETNTNKKTALISGAKGQDASYLAEFLLQKNYNVVAFERKSGMPNYTNIEHITSVWNNYKLESGDVTDLVSIQRLVDLYKPDEFYNLAALSFVGSSWTNPLAVYDVNLNGVINCLEAIRQFSPKTKFYQANTSEVYGDVLTNEQDEDTPARPRSPYGAAKYAAESVVKVYRDSFGLFACFGRLFNHESPRRGKHFVTRKVTDYIGKSLAVISNVLDVTPGTSMTDVFIYAIQRGIIPKLKLGNLDAVRDWSHARDMVRGMWMILQNDKPDDFVLGSGVPHTIRDLLYSAFAVVDIQDWSKIVEIDESQLRPADVNYLCANPSRAKSKLGWETEVTFDALITEMVYNDLIINSQNQNSVPRADVNV